MNTFWSKKVQSTRLLDASRKEKFNNDNKKLWFNLLHIHNNLKILEVGCGRGHFLNMIKTNYPTCEVYGIDLDDGHIKYAKAQSKKLNIDVNYFVADVKHLPFEDNSFDIVFSHTLIEHLPFDDFIQEQKRVLKANGKLVIMRVDMVKRNDKPFEYLENEIGEIFNVIHCPKSVSVGQYLEDPDITMQKLNKYKFKNIKLHYDRIIFYMPDVEKNKKIAISQIERNYQTKLTDAIFVAQKSKMESKKKNKLLNLLKCQYEERLRLLNINQKLYDFESSFLITITATK